MPVHVLGIRHHGPGSARSVLKFLQKLQPDMLLVEGPPEADTILPYAQHQDMKPPVAMLVYRSDQPQRASFYPFATFSPEWQAITYGLKNNIPVRFMDLPFAYRFAGEQSEKSALATEQQEKSSPEHPLSHLAQAAGFQDTELWWEHQFELRTNDQDSFEAIQEGMTALRENLILPEDPENELREAYMRKLIYQAEQDFENIAVICGAWHAPALINRPPKKEDNERLKGLPKCKIEATWVPWTYNRLTWASGYGDGDMSPGWYHHIWNAEQPEERGYGWMTQVARVFRKHQMDTSTAHIIEAVRLADTLAGLRDLPRPGLAEYNEATNTVLSFGDTSLLSLVQEELIVGQRMGEVPAEVPAVPLQFDLQQQQKRTRLKPTDERKALLLDLRKDLDLERSKLLHRLQLLEIRWGTPAYVSGKGTFKEQWNLHWEPEMTIEVIEKGIWGNTIALAASAYTRHQSAQATELSAVAQLLSQTLPADIPDAVGALMQRIDALAAVSGDIFQLMQALPPLVKVSRYGDVRKTDVGMIDHVLESLVSRICIGLPNACTALDEDSATDAYEKVDAMHGALKLLRNDAYELSWYETLQIIADHTQVHGLVAGKACRILSENAVWKEVIVAQKFSLALSTAQPISYSAAWLEGFLQGSGMLLLLDDTLWGLLNQWVESLEDEAFTQALPVLRRSFSNFSKPERRKLGEKARHGKTGPSTATQSTGEAGFNHERAALTLPLISQLLGIQTETDG